MCCDIGLGIWLASLSSDAKGPADAGPVDLFKKLEQKNVLDDYWATWREETAWKKDQITWTELIAWCNFHLKWSMFKQSASSVKLRSGISLKCNRKITVWSIDNLTCTKPSHHRGNKGLCREFSQKLIRLHQLSCYSIYPFIQCAP